MPNILILRRLILSTISNLVAPTAPVQPDIAYSFDFSKPMNSFYISTNAGM